MAKDDPKTAPGVVPGMPTVGVAPKPPGIFEEVERLEAAEGRASGKGERHTLGAWARVKGVKPEQIRQAIKEGRLSGEQSGDGPEMTEDEFDKAVNFEVTNSFGEV